MKQNIMNFLDSMNISYVTLSILVLIVSLLFLSKKKVNSVIKEFYIIVYVSVAWIGFYFLNDPLNTIFNFKFLSIKLYLILLIIGNIIMLININFKINIIYKITNYMLFATNTLIFAANTAIILSNKYINSQIVPLESITTLIDINLIIFIFYLITICIIYIIVFTVNLVNNIKLRKLNMQKPKKETIEEPLTVPNQTSKEKVYSLKENNQEGFYIDGIDCSIIFEDENQDNIMKNYYILLNDVNAKLTNGYTINEYKKIKNIINKLNIKDLNNIELDVNKLNKITIDEYNILKKYLSSTKADYNKN